MIIFGSLMFIPGSYHVFLAIQTFRGVPGYLFDEYPTFDWFLVMISILIFFQNYFLLHFNALWLLYFLLARSRSTVHFRNNSFEFSQNFDRFLCFFACLLTHFNNRWSFKRFLTKVDNLPLFSLHKVKQLC